MPKILVIQTAFIGDVILATALLETLNASYPTGTIDILVRKGNETLFEPHPFINRVHIFDKRKKYQNLFKLIKTIRRLDYDWIVNLQRYFTTGLITVLSGATRKIGFDKNPLACFYTHRIKHKIDGRHEIDRNHNLIETFTNLKVRKPKLYPLPLESKYSASQPYICIAPASVWFTKQWPWTEWVKLIDKLADRFQIYCLGGDGDLEFCQKIESAIGVERFEILAGELSLLESAELMRGAIMNYANDSAALHLASAVNAPITAIFCSTVPAFGFRPLSDKSHIIEHLESLACRPCGLHGKKSCPQKHFHCSKIDIEDMVGKTLGI